MPHFTPLNLKDFTFSELFQADSLNRLDQQFIEYLQRCNASGSDRLLDYRRGTHPLSPLDLSELLLACAPVLEDFLAELFNLQTALETSRQNMLSQQAIFEFKKWFVLRRAKRRVRDTNVEESFAQLDTWLKQAEEEEANRRMVEKQVKLPSPPAPLPEGEGGKPSLLPTSLLPLSSPLPLGEGPGVMAKGLGVKEVFTTPQCTTTQTLEIPSDRELSVSLLAQRYLANQDTYAQEIEKLTRWCILALTSPEGQATVKHWVSFHFPQPLDHFNLVPTLPIAGDPVGRIEGPPHSRRQRQGFQLTDLRMSAKEVCSEIDYCVYCHTQGNDFCSKGFPKKKNEGEEIERFKTDPLGNILTGCPLEQKISESHLLKRNGHTIAALAVVMIDNPFCAVTGHRICNDCMKACIYQKQDPVNIPEVETRILTDVLNLPWGVEIYDLLIRWNPLRPQQWLPKPYNGLKVLIAGQGPAGFSLAHHLLMEGFAVVGIDGLKIEPLPSHLLTTPIEEYKTLQEDLENRIMTGFGGVAEYGITVRWDKNFLKLIYLSLLRRPYFQVYGNIRFGGTLTVEDAWELGFDHLAIAVGAGLPQALSIPGSLAPGMRQATDFLMTLQLTGAAKANSLANLQVRLPAVVIGGGLTGIDTATEVQAYYLVQVEKILHRYEILTQVFGEARIRGPLDEVSVEILDEFLTHGQQLREEKHRAQLAGVEPDVQRLLRDWGGVTVAYRRSLQDSPAYLRNHEEIIKALEEGIFYAPGLEPKAAQLDKHGQVQALVCQKRSRDDTGNWKAQTEEVTLPARSILVATGAKPNVAYEFEHRGHFQRDGIFQYQPFQDVNGTLQPQVKATHCKQPEWGSFTSYTGSQPQQRVTFVGDTHPAFQGSVVKAVASAKQTYPQIVKLFGDRVANVGEEEEYSTFRHQVEELLQTTVANVQRHTPTVVEVQIRAPLIAQKFQPGQFFRLQNFETQAPVVKGTRLQTEAMAMRCAGVNTQQGLISVMVLEQGSSSRLCTQFQPQQPIALMGPTGAKANLPKGGETVMVIGDQISLAEIRTLGPALRATGNRVLYVGCLPTAEEVYGLPQLEAATDALLWVTGTGSPVLTRRPQDCSASGKLLEVLFGYARWELGLQRPVIPFQEVTRVVIIGNHRLVHLLEEARRGILRDYFSPSTSFTASVHGPMQCMLKGVCAQCLLWQVDPVTKQRTKAVFACSWQDQPLEMIDLGNLEERLSQNRLQEYLSGLWLEYLLGGE